jgi:hypothetical protein
MGLCQAKSSKKKEDFNMIKEEGFKYSQTNKMLLKPHMPTFYDLKYVEFEIH